MRGGFRLTSSRRFATTFPPLPQKFEILKNRNPLRPAFRILSERFSSDCLFMTITINIFKYAYDIHTFMSAKAGGVYRLSERGKQVVAKYAGMSVSEVLNAQETTISQLKAENDRLFSSMVTKEYLEERLKSGGAGVKNVMQ